MSKIIMYGNGYPATRMNNGCANGITHHNIFSTYEWDNVKNGYSE